MTFLTVVQILFAFSFCLFLIGMAGLMFSNDTDNPRWMAPLLAGIGLSIVLAIAWGTLEPKASCCKCPAEQVQRP